MDRGRALSALALVVAVIALATVAGGMSGDSSADAEHSPGVGLGSGQGSGLGESSGTGIDAANATESPFPAIVGLAPLLFSLWVITIAGVLAVGVYLWEASLEEFVDALVAGAVRVAAMALLIGSVLALFLFLSQLFGSGGGGLVGGNPAADVQFGSETVPTDSRTVLTGLAVLGAIALAGLLLLALLPSRDADERTTVVGPSRDDGAGETPRSPMQLSSAIEDPGASNEVYRAWSRLRRRAGRDHRAASPAEVRRRAIDAGLDERAVDELTALFNAVRYGDGTATGEQERRARTLAAALDGEEAHRADGREEPFRDSRDTR